MNNVFVYGTLKSGHMRHNALGGATKRDCVSREKFTMRRSSWPYITPDDNGHPVKGEFYQVDDRVVRTLDGIEGFPTLFQKKDIEVQFDDGSRENATVYVIENPGSFAQWDKVEPTDGILVYS